MASKRNLSELSESDLKPNESLSSGSSNKSLRVAEKERRKIQADDLFVLALKYFSDGKTSLTCAVTNGDS